jgi:hypothetical protein
MLAEQPQGVDSSRERTIATETVNGRLVRIRLRVPTGATAGLSELKIAGVLPKD